MLARTDEARNSIARLGEQIQSAITNWLSSRHDHDELDKPTDRLPTRRIFGGPAIDIEETDDTIVVRAELPGLRVDDFTVEATGDRLTIHGEKGEEREERGRGFHRMERRYGSFLRSVALPCRVDPAAATARFRDGVLTTTLPKTESSKPRRIRVDVSGG